MKQPKNELEKQYVVGQTIKHTKFGTGEVINVIPGEAIKVQFGKNTRILLLKYNKSTLVDD